MHATLINQGVTLVLVGRGVPALLPETGGFPTGQPHEIL